MRLSCAAGKRWNSVKPRCRCPSIPPKQDTSPQKARRKRLPPHWMQLSRGLLGVSAADAAKVVVAYEPIWAIGTGKTATSEQAQEVCHAIREVLTEMYGKETAEQMRVQYGGIRLFDGVSVRFIIDAEAVQYHQNCRFLFHFWPSFGESGAKNFTMENYVFRR